MGGRGPSIAFDFPSLVYTAGDPDRLLSRFYQRWAVLARWSCWLCFNVCDLLRRLLDIRVDTSRGLGALPSGARTHTLIQPSNASDCSLLLPTRGRAGRMVKA